MKKIFLLFFLCVLYANGVAAYPQKREKTYQKKVPVYQQYEKTYQKKDLPYSGAYLNVSRSAAATQTDYKKSEAVFEIVEKPDCPKAEAGSESCTDYAVSFSATTDCERSAISLKAEETKAMVALSSKYRQGSCEYDLILKYELGRLKSYRAAVQKFLAEQKTVLNKIYTDGQRGQKMCLEITKNIEKETAGMQQKFANTLKSKKPEYGFERCAVATVGKQ